MTFIKKCKNKNKEQKLTALMYGESGIRMLQQTVHLLDSKLHGKDFVEETECSGGAPAIASHPRLYMVDFYCRSHQ
jgi:hypothetical protein